jgi:hypothetical protein
VTYTLLIRPYHNLVFSGLPTHYYCTLSGPLNTFLLSLLRATQHIFTVPSQGYSTHSSCESAMQILTIQACCSFTGMLHPLFYMLAPISTPSVTPRSTSRLTPTSDFHATLKTPVRIWFYTKEYRNETVI